MRGEVEAGGKSESMTKMELSKTGQVVAGKPLL